MVKRIVKISVLPGQPTEVVKSGAARVCIHLFVPDEQGPFVEPHVLYPELDEFGQPIKQKYVARPTRGRLACNSKKTVFTRTTNVSTFNVTQRSDDPRAVTCIRCKETAEYITKLALVEPVPMTEAEK